MPQDFQHHNPAAPAVVALAIAVVLGVYWLTRREIARGERAEGPPVAHPFALLVQSVLVLVANRWLLVILLGLYLCDRAIGWPVMLARGAWRGDATALLGPFAPGDAAVWFEGAHHFLVAARDGLPTLPSLLSAFWLFPVLGLGAAAWLLRRCVAPPDWLHERMATRALWIAMLSAASAAWGAYSNYLMWVQGGELGFGAGAWESLSAILFGLPAGALVSLYPLVAVYELAIGNRLSYSRVSQRVITAYFPWLALGLLASIPGLVPGLPVMPQHSLVADHLPWTLSVYGISLVWLPIILFPLPWVLLSRGCGLWLGLRESLKLFRYNAALVLVFALRLAAILAPVLFVLGLVAATLSKSLIPLSLVKTVEQFVTIVTAMAVCRACVSMLEQEMPPLANTGADHAE